MEVDGSETKAFFWLSVCWLQLKNIMGGLMTLQDEQIKSGSHVSFQGHEGVVERLFLQGFSLRQYDKGLAYIPNSIMLENSVTVQSKSLDRQCVIPVHLSHSTPTTALRVFIQELDNYLMQHMIDRGLNTKGDVLRLEKPRTGWDIMNVYERSKQLEVEEAQPQGRFWISIEAPYLVHVVYYSQERHIKGLLAEKTEVCSGACDFVPAVHVHLPACRFAHVADRASNYRDDDQAQAHPPRRHRKRL
jgi:small-conductance mechanosensitive channel